MSNRWDETTFICWFVEYLSSTHQTPNKQRRSSLDKRFTAKKKASTKDKTTPNNRPLYHIESGPTLMIRSAYIQLWIDAFVDSSEERTIGQLQNHPLTMPAERNLDTSHPQSTVLDHLLGAVESGSRSAQSDEHSKYLYSVVLPAVKVFFQVLGPRLGARQLNRIYSAFWRALTNLNKHAVANGATDDQVLRLILSIG